MKKNILFVHSLCRWLISSFLMMVFVFGYLNLAFAQKKKKEEKKESLQYVVTGRDPNAFVNAFAMFDIPEQILLDNQTANSILNSIETAIMKGDGWSPKIWSQLDRLRSVRISALQIQSLQNTAQKMIVKEIRLSQDKSTAARRAFEKGNRSYEAGTFDQAIELYRTALELNPAYWDAWNNMALAEMHMNNDLVALFLLSSLTKNNTKYTGGSINLSVCFERLGRDAEAYKVAADLTSEHTQMPMVQYNMAWFENSRGNYKFAADYVGKATAAVDDYTVLKWLKTINTMESGLNFTDEEMKWLPSADQSQGVPKVEIRPVIVGKADAYSGNSVVTQIPKNTQLAISQRSGEWYAVYWNVENTKRLLWVHRANLGDRISTVANDLKPFLGTWTGKWANVKIDKMIISEINGRPKVTKSGYKIWNEKLEDGRLSYSRKVISSGWEFVDTLTPTPKGLKLDVFRLRDKERFSGNLTKR